jgi:surfactin synthase thioesterase subunit
LRLFCLPHAGGSASAFRNWPRWLPEGVDMVPVDMPGHGTRLLEPLVRDLAMLVDDLTGVIARRAYPPFAIFGHSLGALLAFEIARSLRLAGTPPALLIVAGRDGPSAAPASPSIHGLPDVQLLNALHLLGGIPDDLLRHTELLHLFLPALRADLRISETYRRRPGLPLDCPIVVLAGRQDGMTSEIGLLAWRAETTRKCDLVFVDGRHFFLAESEFMAAVTAAIAPFAGLPEAARGAR